MDREKQKKLSDELQNSFLYQTVTTIAQFMDKRFIDPLLGFIFPAVGDTFISILVLPYLYISIFKIKSLALTLAILLNTLIDIMLGIIPWGIGDVLDIFHRSYSKNLKLIEGYIKNDEAIIKEVNKKAWITAVLIVVTCIIIFLLFKLLFTLISGGFHLLTSLFG